MLFNNKIYKWGGDLNFLINQLMTTQKTELIYYIYI